MRYAKTLARNRLVEHLRVGCAIGGVTVAGTKAQSIAIDDGDIATAVANQSVVLQRNGRFSDADAAHAEQGGETFLRHMNFVVMGSIVCH